MVCTACRTSTAPSASELNVVVGAALTILPSSLATSTNGVTRIPSAALILCPSSRMIALGGNAGGGDGGRSVQMITDGMVHDGDVSSFITRMQALQSDERKTRTCG